MSDLSPIEKEAFYDSEIAPVLLEMAKKCQDRKIGFLVHVDYGHEGGEMGQTLTLPAGSCNHTQAVYRAMKNGGNYAFSIITTTSPKGES